MRDILHTLEKIQPRGSGLGSESDDLGLSPGVAICWLCHLGQATWPLGVPTYKVEAMMCGCEDQTKGYTQDAWDRDSCRSPRPPHLLTHPRPKRGRESFWPQTICIQWLPACYPPTFTEIRTDRQRLGSGSSSRLQHQAPGFAPAPAPAPGSRLQAPGSELPD